MNEHDEYLRTRNYAGPLTFREFCREANWATIAVIAVCLGFWGWLIGSVL